MRFPHFAFGRGRTFIGLLLALSGLCIAPARANVPGGGSAGANVTLASTSSTVTLSNGIITAVITKSTARVTSMKYNGVETVSAASSGNSIYFSMDGGTSYENPAGCVYSVTANTGDMADIALKETYSGSQTHPVDWEIHYVLRRGATGLYVYAILSHPASYPDMTIGEWRMVWQLPHTSTDFVFERAYVDDTRHHDMPTYADFANSAATKIAEIGRLTQGSRAGLYNCKYEFGQEYFTYGAWGHASDINKKGAWIVCGGFDFFNDGPTKQDLIIAESYSLIHFGRNHYGASTTVIPTGTDWSKTYGPYFLYCNTANTADAAWLDAQAQSQAEQAAWPYSWLTSNPTAYPPASARGAVSGKLTVNDPMRPAANAANAWVGLAQPDGTDGYNWQFDSNNYQYWAKADANGNFTVGNVRPGTYTLYAFTAGPTGSVGEYSQPGVAVTAGQTAALGNIAWNVTHPGGAILWEVGIPDRTAKEYRHGGTDWYLPYIWLGFQNEFTNPLEYDVDKGNWANDLNYANSVWQVDGTDTTTGALSPWKWNFNFNLPSVPPSGNATLTLAFAGSQTGHPYVYVNGSKTADFYVANDGGTLLLREGVHGKYSVSYVTIPVAKLKVGANVISAYEASTSGEGNVIMFDYLNLELPGPTPGAATWKGGAASNQWDLVTTSNWLRGSATGVYTNYDAVTFTDSGSNSPAINLIAKLKPGNVIFNHSAKNYTLGGAGSLTGGMTLTKAGTGNLTISNANTYTGDTSINAGTLTLSGSLTGSAVKVAQGATLVLQDGLLKDAPVTVDSGGTLTGYGRIVGAFTNNGTVVVNGAVSMSFIGNVVNNGTMRYTSGAAVSGAGSFINNGVLDIITGTQTYPAGFVNRGVVFDSLHTQAKSISFSGKDIQVAIQAHAGHNYQLQRADSPGGPWVNAGAAQTGAESALTFTDNGAGSAGRRFYRVQVSP